MDSRRSWLLAGALPVALGCALAAALSAPGPVGDLSLGTAGSLASAFLWFSAGRTDRPRAWRLLAAVPLLPVVGVLTTALAGSADPLQTAVLRWVLTVPGYLLAIIAILSLVDRSRLRAGARLTVEVTLFLVACLVVVSLLVIGPTQSWALLAIGERMVLGAAVLATSATMAAALVLLGVIEPARRRMAAVLLIGATLLAAGRGLGTSALLAGSAMQHASARFLVGAGMVLLVLALLLDVPRPSAPTRPRPRRRLDVGPLLPHLALLLAVVATSAVSFTGTRPSAGLVLGLVVCIGLAAVHRWLTAVEEQRLGARLRRSESYFRALVESSGDAVLILDGDLRITRFSQSLQRSLGGAAQRLLGRPLLDAVPPEDAAGLAAALPTGADAPGDSADPVGLLLLRLQDDDGVWRYLEAGVSDLRDDADVGAVVLHCRDMTDRHDREQALLSVAYLDAPTGLPNQAGLLQSLERALSRPGEFPGSLLIVELDGIPAVRENVGREATAAVVAEVARRLRAAVRGEDVVARIGGGAFAVLAHGEDDDTDRLASRCLSVVEQPIPTTGGIVDLSAGVGAVALEPGMNVDTLLARGDLAVRAAHQAGPGTAQRYGDALGEAAARRTQLRTDLQSAREQEELFLLFQPIVSLEEQRITGVEAQLCWRHGTLGEIPPAEFFPLAARAGLLGDLVRWALDEVTTVGAGLPAGAGTRVGLNLPDGYMATGGVVTDVEQALHRSGLAPERLVLQIGSSAVSSEDERVGLDIATLRLMGVHVALEGFGSGTSALGHLTRLPIDILKLDRSLITRIDRDPQSRALCESLVGIGRALGLDVVADGVETPAQLAALCGFGCGYAQGFLLARPLPLAQFLVTLSAGELWPGLVGSR